MTIAFPSLAPGCERMVTKPRHSVMRRLRIHLSVFVVAAVAACGGGGRGGRTDTYARATDAQGDCCKQLTGDAEAQCLQQVVSVEEPGVAGHSVNQQTYGCVVQHFVCDKATGRPTPASAQAQLECIQDLEAAGS